MTLEERLSRLEPFAARRVRQTIACRDTDRLTKVADGGAILQRDGQRLQVMHNGLVIEEGCYYGPWMTEIITELGGHHEPQEEVVFAAIIDRLRSHPRPVLDPPVVVELGSFWAYYSMWFCRALPGGRAIDMEPDPEYLAIGQRHAVLNGLSDRMSFTHGAVGGQPGEYVQFLAESTGMSVSVRQYDLAALLRQEGVTQVDLLMVDIQGLESVLLPAARDLLQSGAVRFLVVSTHHQSISGNPLTHQEVRELLLASGAHVLAEHTVRESVSGDGLIAVSFDPADVDFCVEISHARAVDSLWGEPEFEIAELARLVAQRDVTVAHFARHVDHIEAELAAAKAEIERRAAGPADQRRTQPEPVPHAPSGVLGKLRGRR